MRLKFHIKKISATVISAILLSSCLGDQGNTLESYDTGTIIDNGSQTYILMDQINLMVEGSNIPSVDDSEINRCFLTFFIDWDAQSDQAYTTGIYTADINIEEQWVVREFEADAANVAYFAGSDSIEVITEPTITQIEGKNIITFQTEILESENYSFDLLETTSTVVSSKTVQLIYKEGTNVNSGATIREWHSFTLPEITEDYSIILQFKSHTVPEFDHTSINGSTDDSYNCYIFTSTYSPIEEDEDE